MVHTHDPSLRNLRSGILSSKPSPVTNKAKQGNKHKICPKTGWAGLWEQKNIQMFAESSNRRVEGEGIRSLELKEVVAG